MNSWPQNYGNEQEGVHYYYDYDQYLQPADGRPRPPPPGHPQHPVPPGHPQHPVPPPSHSLPPPNPISGQPITMPQQQPIIQSHIQPLQPHPPAVTLPPPPQHGAPTIPGAPPSQPGRYYPAPPEIPSDWEASGGSAAVLLPLPQLPALLTSTRKKKSSLSLLKPITKRLRMGCLTCRQRKKRCCELRPKCTECARLKLNCVWPAPGTEHKNRNKDARGEENTMDHEVYGKIKVLRGIVERK